MHLPTRLRFRGPVVSSRGVATLLPLLMAMGLALVACNVEVPGFQPGGTGSGSGGGGTTSTSTSGGSSDDGATEDYEPDPVACVNPGCNDAADCCVGIQPSLTTGLEADDAGCPSNEFPNNWSCETGMCVHGGCSFDTDCNLYNSGLECKDIGGIGHCVLPCDQQTPCPDLDGNGSPDMLCTGEADDETEFCEQSLS